jgi:hypothetical protein
MRSCQTGNICQLAIMDGPRCVCLCLCVCVFVCLCFCVCFCVRVWFTFLLEQSVVLSGTPVKRPCGQYQEGEGTAPVFGACKQLDFELGTSNFCCVLRRFILFVQAPLIFLAYFVEVGCFIGGPANELGTPISINEAEKRLFGVVCFLRCMAQQPIFCANRADERFCSTTGVRAICRSGSTCRWARSLRRTLPRPSPRGW